MIQDIAPHQFHNEYKAYEIQNGDYVLFYRQRDVLLRYVDEQIVYPKYEEVSDRESRSCIYLFSIDAQRYYFCDETDETLMEAYQFVNIQKMRKGQPKHQAFAGVTGLQASMRSTSSSKSRFKESISAYRFLDKTCSPRSRI